MDASEALEWLHGTQWFGIKLGLENMRRLAAALDVAELDAPILHVAGTNGKGSVCALAESVARAAGCRTGLFTSPHLLRFHERIQLHGRPIDDSTLAAGLTRIRDIVSAWDPHPTYFEIATALALRIFKDARLEVIVLETGMGGRLDSTNIFPDPAVSVITRIDLDHAQYLGNTLAEIAGEKAGIIKTGTPVLTLPQASEVLAVLQQTATACHAPLQILDTPLTGEKIGLAGSHQTWNAGLACRALELAGVTVSPVARARGLAQVQWPGRFQLFDGDLVLDGAHNPAAIRRLMLTWREVFGARKPHIILGILADKDVSAILQELVPHAASFIAVEVRSQRALAAASLARLLVDHGAQQVAVGENVSDALQKVARPALVTGSLFLIGEALAHLQGSSPPPATAQ